MSTYVKQLPQLFDIAIELAAGLGTSERFGRLLSASMQVIPCDAAAVLKLQDHALHPVASLGLKREASSRRFQVSSHPRLERILSHHGVTRFDDNSTLPDPYDGLVVGVEGNLPVHSCMGVTLQVGDGVWGVITFDALRPDAFTAIEDELVLGFSRLAAAAASSADYVATLEQSAKLEHELNQNLLDQVTGASAREMIGDSSAMQALQHEINLVAASDLAVLVSGETGVGKELVARAVHSGSRRSGQAMVYLNCASLPENLVESELFGHRKGAFTGATQNYRGKFQLAHGGTLFLDEIGELPLGAQAKLLRALQSGEVQPLGSEEMLLVDVRIVAATNRDLKTEVLAGRFREDLFHRLNVFPVRVPPLRERSSDIVLLAGYFIEKLAVQFGLRGVTLSAEAENALVSQAWPGNVRELEHAISRALLRVKSLAPVGPSRVEVSHLGTLSAESPAPVRDEGVSRTGEGGELLSALVQQFQAGVIRARVARFGGNWSRAAESLGLHRGNLYRLARRLGIK